MSREEVVEFIKANSKICVAGKGKNKATVYEYFKTFGEDYKYRIRRYKFHINDDGKCEYTIDFFPLVRYNETRDLIQYYDLYTYGWRRLHLDDQYVVFMGDRNEVKQYSEVYRKAHLNDAEHKISLRVDDIKRDIKYLQKELKEKEKLLDKVHKEIDANKTTEVE